MDAPAPHADPQPLLAPALRVSPVVLFTAFLRLGLTAFGDPAMGAYIRDMAVSRKRWLTEESFQNGVVLCQTIPARTSGRP
jgi:chromate transporter